MPNRQRIELFQAGTRRSSEVECVWNCPSASEVAPARGTGEEHIVWVLYHGSIVPERLPLTVIHALVKLPNHIRLRIAGYETVGSVGYLECIRREAKLAGIADRLSYCGVLLRQELMALCRTCDVGLAFVPQTSSDQNLEHMTGASNKPFDYLACGLALLVTDRPDWREMFVEPGFGLACNPLDSESIARALRWFGENRASMRAMGEAGRSMIIREWNYEVQFADVQRRLEQTA